MQRVLPLVDRKPCAAARLTQNIETEASQVFHSCREPAPQDIRREVFLVFVLCVFPIFCYFSSFPFSSL